MPQSFLPAGPSAERPAAAAATPIPVAATAVMPAPAATPILSEDGWWQWDGSAWVPAERLPIPAQPVGVDPRPGYPRSGYVGPGPVHVAPGYGYSGSGVPGYGSPPQQGRDGLAVAALVCSLIPIFVVTQLLALIFAIIVLTRVGRTGRKGQVMAISAIAVSVVMFFLSAAVTIPVFLQQRQQGADAQVRSALRDTADAEESYFLQNQTYASVSQLESAGAQPPVSVEVTVSPDGSAGYCLAGTRLSGRWLSYDSFHGGLQPTVFPSASAALEACYGDAPGGEVTAG